MLNFLKIMQGIFRIFLILNWLCVSSLIATGNGKRYIQRRGYVLNVSNFQVHFLNQEQKFECKESWDCKRLQIYCYKGRPKYIIHLWQSVTVILNNLTYKIYNKSFLATNNIQKQLVRAVRRILARRSDRIIRKPKIQLVTQFIFMEAKLHQVKPVQSKLHRFGE